MRRAGVLLCLLAVVATADILIRWTASSYVELGVLDEPGHLATGALLGAAWSARTGGLARWTWLAVLAASVLIDLDHLPLALGSKVLTEGTPRPYTHSLATVAVLGIAAVLAHGRGRAVLAGCAVGVVGHLLRDLGTAPVALWWPLSRAGVSLPYPFYFAVLFGCLIIALVPPRPVTRRTHSRHPMPR